MYGGAPGHSVGRTIGYSRRYISYPIFKTHFSTTGPRPGCAILPGQSNSGKNPILCRRVVQRGQDMRPKSLAAVAELARNGDSFDRCLANFLDEFYAQPTAGALAEPPGLLAPSQGEIGKVMDAYLAAVAEELARNYQFRLPIWTEEETRKLHRPWFASTLASLRAVLLLESPPGFRSRNLF